LANGGLVSAHSAADRLMRRSRGEGDAARPRQDRAVPAPPDDDRDLFGAARRHANSIGAVRALPGRPLLSRTATSRSRHRSRRRRRRPQHARRVFGAARAGIEPVWRRRHAPTDSARTSSAGTDANDVPLTAGTAAKSSPTVRHLVAAAAVGISRPAGAPSELRVAGRSST
jgi:hypothetical protein